jgi:hypothetical protein
MRSKSGDICLADIYLPRFIILGHHIMEAVMYNLTLTLLSWSTDLNLVPVFVIRSVTILPYNINLCHKLLKRNANKIKIGSNLLLLIFRLSDVTCKYNQTCFKRLALELRTNDRIRQMTAY